MNSYANAKEYQQNDVNTSVYDASPEKLIELLLSGAIQRISIAKGAMDRGDRALQGELIGKVIDIVASLDSYLDHDNGGDISESLESLYDYVIRQLYQANLQCEISILEEVSLLLTEVHSGWIESVKP